MLASVVLASFRSSTYPRVYASRSSLAAALPDGLFEHSETNVISAPFGRFHQQILYINRVSRSLLKPRPLIGNTGMVKAALYCAQHSHPPNPERALYI